DGHCAHAGQRVLQEDPLRTVDQPDTDVITGLHAGGHEALGHPVDLGRQLGVRPALVAEDEGLAVSPATGGICRDVAEAALGEPVHCSLRSARRIHARRSSRGVLGTGPRLPWCRLRPPGKWTKLVTCLTSRRTWVSSTPSPTRSPMPSATSM